MESTTYTVAGQEFELQHHGVKGMRWGVRKKKYVTVRQGTKNANAAGREAWQKTTTENGGKLVGKDKNVAVYKNPVAMRRGRAAAQTARNDAIKESIKNDKAANKAERQRAKAEKKQLKADVKDFEKNGFDIDYEINAKTGHFIITGYRNSKQQKIGAEYAERIMQEHQKRNARKYLATATGILGATVVSAMLSSRG
jgi:hypothetical protein